MKGIKAIGFDMDYTLAQYKPETFEALAYEKTVDKLVNVFGYPPSLKDLTFEWEYMAKGWYRPRPLTLPDDHKQSNMT